MISLVLGNIRRCEQKRDRHFKETETIAAWVLQGDGEDMDLDVNCFMALDLSVALSDGRLPQNASVWSLYYRIHGYFEAL